MVDRDRLRTSKARWIVPLLGCCAAVAVAALLMTPMMLMSPRDIPVALLSEDAGVTVGDTEVNIGNALVESLTSRSEEDGSDEAEGDEEKGRSESSGSPGASEGAPAVARDDEGAAVNSDAVRWIVVHSRTEMEKLLEEGTCYGALVVPRDFSESSVAVRGREMLGWALVDKLPDLASGATALAEGAQGVSDGADAVAEGAGTLSAGASTLASGTSALSSGAAKLAQGTASLAGGSKKLASGAAALQEKASTLPEGMDKLAAGARSLNEGSGKIERGAESLEAGAQGVAAGSAKAGELVELARGAMGSGNVQGADQALGAAASAIGAAGAGAGRLSQGAAALKDGAVAAGQGAKALDDGISAVAASAPALVGGVGSLASGSDGVASGSAKLDAGAAALVSGTIQLEEGAQALALGAGSLAEGSQKLASGADALAVGTGQLAEGLKSANGVLDLLPAVTDKMLDGDQEAAFSGLDVDLGLFEGTDSPVGDAGGETEGANEGEGKGDSSSGSDAGGADEEAADEVLGTMPAIPEAASLELVINQGKNPMVSSSLSAAVTALGGASGTDVTVTYLNPLPEGLTMGYTHMILMMMTYLGSYITAVVVYNLFTPGRGRHQSGASVVATVAVQAAYAVACALVVGGCATGIVYGATGADVSYGDLWLYVAICSLTFQMLVLGSLDLFGMAGMAVPVGLLILGMGTAYLPTEFLPDFYQNYVYPWDPLRFMADGYRGILYMGQGFWNPSSWALMIVVGLGVAMMAVSAIRACLPRKPKESVGFVA